MAPLPADVPDRVWRRYGRTARRDSLARRLEHRGHDSRRHGRAAGCCRAGRHHAWLADIAERQQMRNERWEALAVLTMVVPPAALHVAAHMAARGEALLDPNLDEGARHAVYVELWQLVNEFTRLARADLKVGDEDVFAGLEVVPGDRLSFERPAAKSV